MADVVLAGVSRIYPGGVVAVNHLDLEAREGEFLVLLGPSGCGKTTTLRLIAGLEEPSAGEIRIAGRPMSGVPPHKRDLAMVFQGQALYPHWTVEQNLAFGLQLRHERWPWRWLGALKPGKSSLQPGEATDSAVAERVREAARCLGIESLLGRLPGTLSGGQRQRVALARAWVRRPAAFLLDEPLSNLDANLRGELRQELKKLHARDGVTTLYVTHDQTEAFVLADRVAVINGGTLQQVGMPLTVYDFPDNLFVAGFLGSPPWNLWPGKLFTVDADRPGSVRFVGENWSTPVFQPPDWLRQNSLDERPLVMGIKPADLRLERGAEGAGEICVQARIESVEAWPDATVAGWTMAEEESRKQGNEKLWFSKWEEREHVRPGDRVTVTWNVGRMHWFDGVSGRRMDQRSKRAPTIRTIRTAPIPVPRGK